MKQLSYDEQHRERYPVIADEIGKLVEPGSRILDFGAHTGALSFLLNERGYDVSCVDLPEIVEEQRSRFAMQGLALQAVECGQVPFPTGWFDCIAFCDVLEHMHESPLLLLTEFRRVLKPGGVLVLTTPNGISLENRLKMLLGITVWHDLDRYLFYPRLALHFKEYTEHELGLLISRYAGFANVRTKTFDFVGGRTELRRTMQRMIYNVSRFLPALRNSIMVIAERP